MDTQTMTSRTLGPARLAVSAVGLGCMGMSQGYGRTDDAESIATVHRAIDLGVTFLDTAMSYGGGHNERLLGRALVGRREQVVVAGKFGIVRDPGGEVGLDGRPEHVRGSCEASVALLGVDHLVDALERAASVHPITALQCEWSLWWREPEDDVIPTARRLGIGVVPYSPLGRGFLTGAVSTEEFGPEDFRRRDPRFAGEHLARNTTMVEQVRRLAADHGVTSAQLVLAWLLAQGDDVVPIPGTRHPERVAENAAAVELTLARADLEQLEALVGRSAWVGDRQAFAAHRSTRRPV